MKRKGLWALFGVLMVFTSAFAQNDRKPAYGVLLDNSGSLRLQIPQIKLLAKELVRRLHQRGPVSLFRFVNQDKVLAPYSDVEWTQDSDRLYQFIDSLAVTAGRTTLFDSIHSIAERIDIRVRANSAGTSEKILILITDGEDRDSQISQQRLIEDLRKNGYKLYAIGLVQDLEERPKKMAIQFLSEITTSTGGRAIFPKDKFKVDAVLDELLTP